MADIFADTKDIYLILKWLINTLYILIFPLKELKEDALLKIKSSNLTN